MLQKLVLTQFRNYARLTWAPDALVTVFYGENGAGKTNLLEALSLLSPGRGLRGAPLPQMARFGADGWGVAAIIHDQHEARDVGVGYNAAMPGRRQVQLDGQSVKSQADLAGLFPVIWLTPQMDRLFSEGAGGRRRFFDRLVFSNNPLHARELAAHDTAVQHRNRLLAERPDESAWLSAVEDSIARHAVAVTAERLALIDAIHLQSPSDPIFPLPEIALSCDIGDALLDRPALEVEDGLRARLLASRVQDREARVTRIGAHRADYAIRDRVTGRSAQFSSSGQQKTLLVGIILCHAAIVAARHSAPPALLLDEPLVHLDDPHRHALLRAVEAMQAPVMMSGTDVEDFKGLSTMASRICVRDNALHS